MVYLQRCRVVVLSILHVAVYCNAFDDASQSTAAFNSQACSVGETSTAKPSCGTSQIQQKVSRQHFAEISEVKQVKFKLIQKDSDCQSSEVDLGDQESAGACADACNAAKGCVFFKFGTGKQEGQCLFEQTKSHAWCSEGFKAVHDYNFYKVLQPASFNLIKEGNECLSKDEDLGSKETLEECAEACVETEGCVFFIYGTSKKNPGCHYEKTTSTRCPEGWSEDSYNFYKLDCPTGHCTIWGDPHVTIFDQKYNEVSLLNSLSSPDVPTNSTRHTNSHAGDVWLVKNDQVHIQGRYNLLMRTQNRPFLRSVAIGGPFLNGNTLIVEPQEMYLTDVTGPLQKGRVLWNKQEILTNLQHDNQFSVNSLLSVSYSKHVPLVSNEAKQTLGVVIDLPLGVSMTVNRHKRVLGIKIDVQKPLNGTMDGECGNYNGNAGDDTAQMIQQRVGQGIPYSDLLFHEPFNPFTSLLEEEPSFEE